MVNKTVFYIMFLLAMILIGCVGQTKEGCENGKRNVEQLKLRIILTKKPHKNYRYILEGKSVETGKDTIYKYGGRWFDQLGNYWDVGDTIIKKKGKLFLEIHKRDTIHISEWRCDDILIDGVSVSELRKRKMYGR